MALTPDQLTQRYYHERGYHITKVEGWGFYPDIHRTDFLGIYDFLAFNDDEIIAVQTTTKSNRSSRWHKMLKSKSFAWWTKGKGRRSVLLTWYKEKGKWMPKYEELTMKDWDAYQQKLQEEMNKIDTESDLYKMLFPEGTAVPTTTDKEANTMGSWPNAAVQHHEAQPAQQQESQAAKEAL